MSWNRNCVPVFCSDLRAGDKTRRRRPNLLPIPLDARVTPCLRAKIFKEQWRRMTPCHGSPGEASEVA